MPDTIRILHISDPHLEKRSMRKLEWLARHTDCEVVALTGDCYSDYGYQLPSSLNDWPQSVKLSVPGDHGDHARTYELLNTWTHQTPWTQRVQDVLFVGCEVDYTATKIAAHIATLGSTAIDSAKAIVWLSHRRIYPGNYRPLGELVIRVAEGKRLLILHGHKHERAFRLSGGSDWECPCASNDVGWWRSHVYSGSGLGVGHLISWTGEAFSCLRVEGAE